MKTYRLPPKFYADHVARDLPEEGVSNVVHRNSKVVTVEMDQAAFADLLSDAEYYSDQTQFERDLFGLCKSARATHRILVEEGPPASPKLTRPLGKSAPCPGCKSTAGAYTIKDDKPVCVYCGAELEL